MAPDEMEACGEVPNLGRQLSRAKMVDFPGPNIGILTESKRGGFFRKQKGERLDCKSNKKRKTYPTTKGGIYPTTNGSLTRFKRETRGT